MACTALFWSFLLELCFISSVLCSIKNISLLCKLCRYMEYRSAMLVFNSWIFNLPIMYTQISIYQRFSRTNRNESCMMGKSGKLSEKLEIHKKSKNWRNTRKLRNGSGYAYPFNKYILCNMYDCILYAIYCLGSRHWGMPLLQISKYPKYSKYKPWQNFGKAHKKFTNYLLNKPIYFFIIPNCLCFTGLYIFSCFYVPLCAFMYFYVLLMLSP